jgi:acyl carrier protein
MTVYERLQKLIPEFSQVDMSAVTAETPLDQLGDSIVLLGLVLAVEEEFDLDLSNEQPEEFTVGQFATFIEEQLGK